MNRKIETCVTQFQLFPIYNKFDNNILEESEYLEYRKAKDFIQVFTTILAGDILQKLKHFLIAIQ